MVMMGEKERKEEKKEERVSRKGLRSRTYCYSRVTRRASRSLSRLVR